MTNNIAKIRAALRSHLPMSHEQQDALAALAELDRAAAEPVAWMWNDEIGVPHASAGSKKPVWLESSASAEYIKQANLRPLYAAPPAPVAAAPQFVAGELSDAVARKLWREWFDASGITGVESAHFWLKALRRELGPALGMVEIREPDDEQYRAIADEFLCNVATASRGVRTGRAMFNAVRAVMWPKEGL